MVNFKVRNDVAPVDLLEVDTRPSAIEIQDHFIVVVWNVF